MRIGCLRYPKLRGDERNSLPDLKVAARHLGFRTEIGVKNA